MLTFLIGLILASAWLHAAGWLGRHRHYVAMVAMLAVAIVSVIVTGSLVDDYAAWLYGVNLGSMTACVANVVLLRRQREIAGREAPEKVLVSH